MPDDAIHHADSLVPRNDLSRSVPSRLRLSVLSADASRPKHRAAELFATAAAHGLVLTALLAGIPSPPVQNEAATVELITVPAPQPVEPDPQPPPEPAATETAADPVTPIEAAAPQDPQPQDPQPQDPQPQDPTPPDPVTAEPAPQQLSPAPVENPPPPPPVAERPSLPLKPVSLRPAPPRPTARTASPAPVQSGASDTAPQQTHAADTLKARIRDAVQAAVRCPAAARMMGLSGKAGIAFDYLDGVMTSAPALTRSSGAPILDAAALNAVRSAHYPAAPPEASAQPLHLLVWVEEACNG